MLAQQPAMDYLQDLKGLLRRTRRASAAVPELQLDGERRDSLAPAQCNGEILAGRRYQSSYLSAAGILVKKCPGNTIL